jgi:hypothetical protein
MEISLNNTCLQSDGGPTENGSNCSGAVLSVVVEDSEGKASTARQIPPDSVGISIDHHRWGIPDANTEATKYVLRWYKRFTGGNPNEGIDEDGHPNGLQMVIPICGITTFNWKNGKRTVVRSKDIVHPNITVFRGSHSKRFKNVKPQNIGTTKGLFPFNFVRTVHVLRGNPPDILLLWPIWELTDKNRLPALPPCVDAAKHHGMQIAFCLSRWAMVGNTVWVLIPIDSLLVNGSETTWRVEFAEHSKYPASKKGQQKENRIWFHPQVKVVLYRTRDSVDTYKLEASRQTPHEKSTRNIEDRSDQVLLKRWMLEAVRCQRNIVNNPPPKPSIISKDVPFNQSTIYKPTTDLTVRVHSASGNWFKDYPIPCSNVFVSAFPFSV